MQEYTHTFTIYFLSKLPLIYSAVYIYIKAINQKCSKSKVALYLTAFFGISLISALLNILNNGISILATVCRKNSKFRITGFRVFDF